MRVETVGIKGWRVLTNVEMYGANEACYAREQQALIGRTGDASMSMARATEKQAAGDLPGIDARERGSERSWGLQKACRGLHGGLETALLLGLEAQVPRILRLVAVGSVVLTAKLQCGRKLAVCLIYCLFPSRGGCFELASGGGVAREIDGDALIPKP
jgi:hypothetical protein